MLLCRSEAIIGRKYNLTNAVFEAVKAYLGELGLLLRRRPPKTRQAAQLGDEFGQERCTQISL